LAILAAPDVQQVVLARVKGLSDRHRPHLELVPPPRRPPGQHRDVAAVGIDVQIVGVEVPDDDLHAARSQYGRAKPRPSTIVRTASFAPAGFLISSIRTLRSPTAIRSKRPNAALKDPSPETISSNVAPSVSAREEAASALYTL